MLQHISEIEYDSTEYRYIILFSLEIGLAIEAKIEHHLSAAGGNEIKDKEIGAFLFAGKTYCSNFLICNCQPSMLPSQAQPLMIFPPHCL